MKVAFYRTLLLVVKRIPATFDRWALFSLKQHKMIALLWTKINFQKISIGCYSLHSDKLHVRIFKAMDTFCMRLSGHLIWGVLFFEH